MQDKPKTMVVNWATIEPTKRTTDCFQWQEKALKPDTLDSRLKLPQGTIAILFEALALNLSRSTLWNLRDISNREPYIAAARLYRRGVFCDENSFIPKTGLYPITIHENQNPQSLFDLPNRLIIIDSNVAHLWKITESDSIIIHEIDEKTKNLESVAKIIELTESKMLASPSDIDIYIIGGGVLCDTAAFAMSLMNKSFHLVPTTLLAMVDACVGGKTGVNAQAFGKNQIGLFSFPSSVSIYPQWLSTLDERHIKCGYAECIKHAIISGQLSLAESIIDNSNKGDIIGQMDLLECIAIKAKIVERDPEEQGERATLNLGHTLAHALEKISQERVREILLHGEAVAIGLVYAILLSINNKTLPEPIGRSLIELIKSSNTLIKKDQLKAYLLENELDSPEFFQTIMQALSFDKKSENKRIRWVLLGLNGTPHIENGCYTHELPIQVMKKSWKQLVHGLA